VLAASSAPWLLVFDNAPNHASVARFVPPAGPGRVLITSRNQIWPPGQEHRARRQPQHPARRPLTGRPRIRPVQLVQRALDPGAQPLDQPLQIAELRRTHLAGHLSPERQHQRRPGRILQIRQPHIGNARTQQRHPRDAALTRPPELKMSDRKPLRIAVS